jgi:hypothetical protein
MKPGLFVLHAQIENPKKDLRVKRDWTMAKHFPTGHYKVRRLKMKVRGEEVSYLQMSRIGEYPVLVESDTRFELIAEHLQEREPTLAYILEEEFLTHETVLARLWEMKLIDQFDLAKVVAAIREEEGDE